MERELLAVRARMRGRQDGSALADTIEEKVAARRSHAGKSSGGADLRSTLELRRRRVTGIGEVGGLDQDSEEKGPFSVVELRRATRDIGQGSVGGSVVEDEESSDDESVQSEEVVRSASGGVGRRSIVGPPMDWTVETSPALPRLDVSGSWNAAEVSNVHSVRYFHGKWGQEGVGAAATALCVPNTARGDLIGKQLMNWWEEHALVGTRDGVGARTVVEEGANAAFSAFSSSRHLANEFHLTGRAPSVVWGTSAELFVARRGGECVEGVVGVGIGRAISRHGVVALCGVPGTWGNAIRASLRGGIFSHGLANVADARRLGHGIGKLIAMEMYGGGGYGGGVVGLVGGGGEEEKKNMFEEVGFGALRRARDGTWSRLFGGLIRFVETKDEDAARARREARVVPHGTKVGGKLGALTRMRSAAVLLQRRSASASGGGGGAKAKSTTTGRIEAFPKGIEATTAAWVRASARATSLDPKTFLRSSHESGGSSGSGEEGRREAAKRAEEDEESWAVWLELSAALKDSGVDEGVLRGVLRLAAAACLLRHATPENFRIVSGGVTSALGAESSPALHGAVAGAGPHAVADAIEAMIWAGLWGKLDQVSKGMARVKDVVAVVGVEVIADRKDAALQSVAVRAMRAAAVSGVDREAVAWCERWLTAMGHAANATDVERAGNWLQAGVRDCGRGGISPFRDIASWGEFVESIRPLLPSTHATELVNWISSLLRSRSINSDIASLITKDPTVLTIPSTSPLSNHPQILGSTVLGSAPGWLELYGIRSLCARIVECPPSRLVRVFANESIRSLSPRIGAELSALPTRVAWVLPSRIPWILTRLSPTILSAVAGHRGVLRGIALTDPVGASLYCAGATNVYGSEEERDGKGGGGEGGEDAEGVGVGWDAEVRSAWTLFTTPVAAPPLPQHPRPSSRASTASTSSTTSSTTSSSSTTTSTSTSETTPLGHTDVLDGVRVTLTEWPPATLRIAMRRIVDIVEREKKKKMTKREKGRKARVEEECVAIPIAMWAWVELGLHSSHLLAAARLGDFARGRRLRWALAASSAAATAAQKALGMCPAAAEATRPKEALPGWVLPSVGTVEFPIHKALKALRIAETDLRALPEALRPSQALVWIEACIQRVADEVKIRDELEEYSSNPPQSLEGYEKLCHALQEAARLDLRLTDVAIRAERQRSAIEDAMAARILLRRGEELGDVAMLREGIVRAEGLSDSRTAAAKAAPLPADVARARRLLGKLEVERSACEAVIAALRTGRAIYPWTQRREAFLGASLARELEARVEAVEASIVASEANDTSSRHQAYARATGLSLTRAANAAQQLQRRVSRSTTPLQGAAPSVTRHRTQSLLKKTTSSRSSSRGRQSTASTEEDGEEEGEEKGVDDEKDATEGKKRRDGKEKKGVEVEGGRGGGRGGGGG